MGIQIKKICEVIRKEGLKGFFRRWKDGIQKVSQEDLLRADIIAHIGMIIGTVLALLFFIFIAKQFWILSIPLSFNIVLQLTSLIAKYQQLNALLDLKKKLNELNLKGGEEENV